MLRKNVYERLVVSQFECWALRNVRWVVGSNARLNFFPPIDFATSYRSVLAAKGNGNCASSAAMYKGCSLCMVFTLLVPDISQKPEGNQRTGKRVIRAHTREGRSAALISNR